jgi:predicted esterase YcpF (UPF0227 family)
MKTIVFLHGFGSSGATKTADYLREKLTDTVVISPDIPLEPKLALRELHKLCHDVNPDVIIGTSMGAMYAQQMHGFRKILVNPAFHVSLIMRQNLGINKFTNPRKDSETEFNITEWLCDDYEIMEKYQFYGITAYDKAHTYAFFGAEDTLVNGYEEYLKYYSNATQYPGGHSLLQKWVKAYVLPCVQKLLEEEPDMKNINSKKMYELLGVISEGGKRGHQAFEDLWKACYPDFFDIADRYHGVYNPMKTMKDGLRKAVYSFVLDYEEMPYKNFSKKAYHEVESLFKEKKATKAYYKIVDKGRKMDPIHAMKLMTKLYMDNCGISLGERTLAYDAGSGWLKKYIEDNPEQTEWDSRTCFVDVMPAICADYDKEVYDRYDIGCSTIEEEREMAIYSATSFDSDIAAALCWGIEHVYQDMQIHNYYLLSKVIIEKDKSLDMTERAILYYHDDAEKEIQKWTEQNREHLLCYIVKEIPREKVFRDEPASAFCHWPDEPYIEDNDFKEFVYMPSGFQQKHRFNVGDLIEYIYHDRNVTTLKWGCIAKLPSKKDPSVLILDGKKTWEGLSKEAYIASSVKVPMRYVFPLRNYSI